ncbi:MAG: ADP-ribosylglycohydrolase family protein [Acidobacteriota bacterium]|nr:ADP-ribosylglycohydrolase family protein [Acidobacteriota bacterium]
MLGAIAGDVFGASYEFRSFKSEDFDLFDMPRFFTDDTVLTIATAEVLMGDGDYASAYRRWGRDYPSRSYGGRFLDWLEDSSLGPYNSYGNGSAMRVSPIGWAFDSLAEVLAEAERSAAVTHNHPEGIKGAQATAGAIYLARTGQSQEEIRNEIAGRFGYDLDRTVEEIRPDYSFDVTCQGSVPEALIAFFDADDFEHSIRLAISLDGDADTQAAITGGVAEAFWGGVPERLNAEVREVLDDPLLEIMDRFFARYRS